MNGNETPEKFGLISRVNIPVGVTLTVNLFSKHAPSNLLFHK